LRPCCSPYFTARRIVWGERVGIIRKVLFKKKSPRTDSPVETNFFFFRGWAIRDNGVRGSAELGRVSHPVAFLNLMQNAKIARYDRLIRRKEQS